MDKDMSDLEIKINAELVFLAEFYGRRGNTAKARELLRIVERRRQKFAPQRQKKTAAPGTRPLIAA
jgi:hypothetical protein